MATELSNQTISFTSNAPTGVTLDSPIYTPAVSSTSGLPVTITVDSSSSGVCSIDGSGNVSFQGAGTCTLNANQVGSVDYNPAPQVQQSFAVAPVGADTSVDLDCPTTVTVNTTVTCTITVTNDGPAAANDASFTMVIPSSLTGASVSGDAILSGQYITWTSPSIVSSDSASFTFSATASVAGKIHLNAALLQTSPDPDNSNNIVSKTVNVL